MDEEYSPVNRRALWKRRLIIAALLVPVIALGWGIEAAYDAWRVNSGSNAWFVVSTEYVSGHRGGGYSWERLSSFDHYATKQECDETIEPRFKIRLTCKKMLITDARKLMQFNYQAH